MQTYYNGIQLYGMLHMIFINIQFKTEYENNQEKANQHYQLVYIVHMLSFSSCILLNYSLFHQELKKF